MDGRKLFIVAAVSREDAVKLKDNKKKVETGSRNLYLAREGCESTYFVALFVSQGFNTFRKNYCSNYHLLKKYGF